MALTSFQILSGIANGQTIGCGEQVNITYRATFTLADNVPDIINIAYTISGSGVTFNHVVNTVTHPRNVTRMNTYDVTDSITIYNDNAVTQTVVINIVAQLVSDQSQCALSVTVDATACAGVTFGLH